MQYSLMLSYITAIDGYLSRCLEYKLLHGTYMEQSTRRRFKYTHTEQGVSKNHQDEPENMDALDPLLLPLHTMGVTFGKILAFVLIL